MMTPEHIERTVSENTGLVSLLVGKMLRLFPRA